MVVVTTLKTAPRARMCDVTEGGFFVGVTLWTWNVKSRNARFEGGNVRITRTTRNAIFDEIARFEPWNVRIVRIGPFDRKTAFRSKIDGVYIKYTPEVTNVGIYTGKLQKSRLTLKICQIQCGIFDTSHGSAVRIFELHKRWIMAI